jgi:hypothetical protein
MSDLAETYFYMGSEEKKNKHINGKVTLKTVFCSAAAY